ncbi:MAG: restriction endonuclease [Myxococcales bacterium]|nr:restriction endonuclease [Myxococcales bacterium]MBL0193393.1 restriction endonuclease [Myxococcales bacterium]HQY64471.1 HTH domain-containing protein [Polyangiaceae bacterium]
MTFTEAAAEVLRLAGKPLHYKEITELAVEKNLLSHVGKSPEVTMGARLAALLKKEDKTNPIIRVKPGVFALRDWNEKKKKNAPEPDVADDEGVEGSEVNALEVEAATRVQQAQLPFDDDDAPAMKVSGEDALRADLAASGADVFDDEEDDDQPILAPPPSSSDGVAAAEGGPDGGRRRRRRRRRGRGARDEGGVEATGTERTEPGFSVEGEDAAPARDPLAPAPRPQIRERHQIMAGGAPTGIDAPAAAEPRESEDLSGRELADAAVMVLGGFDRNQGAIAQRTVAEALARRGRLAGDPQLAQSQLMASLRADNLRRQDQGQRPRFRFAQGFRVALTDWALSPELVRLEQEALAAVERYREAARRAMLRKLQELPGHAFVELALLALERSGMTNLRTIRRAGAPGGESHFAATHKNGADEIRTAIVVRRDGREIGRERVTDLRGALHHYGPAQAGWLVTTGQVLSGARDEAAAPNAAPVALFDGVALVRLLEESDVAVIRTKHVTAIPDLELLEMLRG